jgi:hypothetical protein
MAIVVTWNDWYFNLADSSLLIRQKSFDGVTDIAKHMSNTFCPNGAFDYFRFPVRLLSCIWIGVGAVDSKEVLIRLESQICGAFLQFVQSFCCLFKMSPNISYRKMIIPMWKSKD